MVITVNAYELIQHHCALFNSNVITITGVNSVYNWCVLITALYVEPSMSRAMVHKQKSRSLLYLCICLEYGTKQIN